MKILTVGEFYEMCKQRGFNAYIYENNHKNTRKIIAEFSSVDIKLDPLGDFICFKIGNMASLDFRWVRSVNVCADEENQCEFHVVCEEYNEECKPELVYYKIIAIKY